ncbi:hypothetical protein [Pedobacter sp. SYSU D00535]|uniref:hypothetical protein n=1 Tax=Pedobacter sp. SYSU D00535 TaxID=2810308 RepID=UPI001A962D73|nr:hypothetical protein [Pedobacter sp. SYSU D00535]
MQLPWFSELEEGLSMQQVAELIEDYVNEVPMFLIRGKYKVGSAMIQYYVAQFYIGASHLKQPQITITIKSNEEVWQEKIKQG